MKTLIVLLFLSSFNAFAQKCIVLTDYQIDVNRHAQSEITDFNQQRFTIYKDFIMHENKIVSNFSYQIESLYENETSDAVIQQKLKELEAKKAKSIADNCTLYKNKLKKLVESF